MKPLIIGAGQVGKSLHKALSIYDPVIIDQGESTNENVGVLHICFPYSNGFVYQVRKYKAEYNPDYTVIHSTVPIGTTANLQAFHSPVRGVHPDLTKSMLTFITFLAPKNKILADYFRLAGFNIKLISNSEDTEAGKLFSTLQYGIQIMVEKQIYNYCEANGLNFDTVYRLFNMTYNKGYDGMGHDCYRKPILEHIPGKIGGHCVMQNADLLDHWLSDLLKNVNESF